MLTRDRNLRIPDMSRPYDEFADKAEFFFSSQDQRCFQYHQYWHFDLLSRKEQRLPSETDCQPDI
ncbi:hypothetical protein F4083_06630 [Candidatus Poribacteria bacterium]|nr:hypothetical protein [Candidatus Poribacteria bacterium]